MCMNDLSPYLWLNLKQYYQLNITQILWDSSTSRSLQIRNLKALNTRLVKYQKILQPEMFNSFMKWAAIADWYVVLKPASWDPAIRSRLHQDLSVQRLAEARDSKNSRARARSMRGRVRHYIIPWNITSVMRSPAQQGKLCQSSCCAFRS